MTRREELEALAEVACRPGWRVEWAASFDGAWSTTIWVSVTSPDGENFSDHGWLDEWGDDGETPPLERELAIIAGLVMREIGKAAAALRALAQEQPA